MIKKIYRKTYRALLGKRLTENEFRYVVKSLLGIKKGDSILVHASFGNMKAGFSPKRGVEILMGAVGLEGNILMPYYPYDSKKFLEAEEVFDVKTTPTRSGILSAVFSTFPGVRKSIHPIKSLAVWGKDRDYLISEHHLSQTPFDEKSPYYKLSTLKKAKSLGLGTYKNSFVHCAEDIISGYPKHYYNHLFQGKCTDYAGNTQIINTTVHLSAKLPRYTGYLIDTKCPEYEIYSYLNRFFFKSNVKKIIEHFTKLFTDEGVTAYSYFENKRCLHKLIHIYKYKLNG